MFVVLCYDVRKERVARMLKVARKYLRPVQRSVLDGFLTEAELKRLKTEIFELVDTEKDSIHFYRCDSPSTLRKEQLGRYDDRNDRFL